MKPDNKKIVLLALFVAVFSFCLHFIGIGTLPLMDPDEPRFAEASREMRERGDYIVPHLNNEERLHKPAFFYWCQTASFRFFGENDAAARLPSVIASVLTALLIFGFGCRLYGSVVGFWAALVFTLCPLTLILSKASTVDMVLVFFTTFAIWAGWEWLQTDEHKSGFSALRLFWWGIFNVAMAMAFLTKGPLGFLPLLSLVFFGIRTRKLDSSRSFEIGLGLLLMILLISFWAVPALIQTHGRYWSVGIGKHVIRRSLDPFEKHGSKSFWGYLLTLPFYFATFFPAFLPWALFFPALVKRRFKEKKYDAKEIYLWSNALLIFILFTFIRTKLPHYSFPAFPILALLFAADWFKKGERPNRLMTLCTGTAMMSLAVSLALFPLASRFFLVPQLLLQSSPWLKPEMEFAQVKYNEPSVIWYFRKFVHGWRQPAHVENVPEFMQRPGPRFCILPTDQFTKMFSVEDLKWKIFSAQGINFSNGRWVKLTMLVKE